MTLRSLESLDSFQIAPSTGTLDLDDGGVRLSLEGVGPYGRFVPGGWWIVPRDSVASLIARSPATIREGERVMHGAMLDPQPAKEHRTAQGYDSAMYAQYRTAADFDPALCATLNLPLDLRPNTSLVCAVSHPTPGQRPQLRRASVLTVLSEPPKRGSFRPPYGVGLKTIWRLADVQPIEHRLIPAGLLGQPSFDSIARWFRQPWLDHVPGWTQRYMHPSENMPDYGREIHELTGTAALMLALDVPARQKLDLFKGYVQLGIDLYGLARELHGRLAARGITGKAARLETQRQLWPTGGGHGNGRKMPILFAGLVLGEQDMLDICGVVDSPVSFCEDGQTFIVQGERPELGYGGSGDATIGKTAFSEPVPIGTPEWGNKHDRQPEDDDGRWLADSPPLPGQTQHERTNQGVKYRRCCTTNAAWGSVLAAAAFGLRDAWGHEPYFCYQRRYYETEREVSSGGLLCWPAFSQQWPLRVWESEAERLGL